MQIGYARVSTDDQSTELQVDALRKAGCKRIFEEKVSGAKEARPKLAEALEFMREGDELVVWKLDRLGRSLKDLLSIIEGLEKRGVAFKALTEGFDTTTPAGRLFFAMAGAFAQYEREMIRERTQAGLAIARANGRSGGRPRSLDESDLQYARALMADPTIPISEIADRLCVSSSTIYRALPGGRSSLSSATNEQKCKDH